MGVRKSVGIRKLAHKNGSVRECGMEKCERNEKHFAFQNMCDMEREKSARRRKKPQKNQSI